MAEAGEGRLSRETDSAERPLLIDTYAWIEYFRATRIGMKAADLIDVDDPTQPRYTHSLCLYEFRRAYKDKTAEFDRDLPFVKDRARVIEGVDEKLAILAARLKNELEPVIRRALPRADLSTVDCVLLALALDLEMKVVTGDQAFGVLANNSQGAARAEPLEFEIDPNNKKVLAEHVHFLK